jgi:beta-lactamase regulating signal transducer with metallopeptidase domain
VKVKKKQESRTSDSTHAQQKDSSRSSASETSAIKKNVNSQTSDNSKDTHKVTKAFRIPWYAYLIGIIVILALALYLYYRYRYQIIAWFLRLRNPGSNVYYDPRIKGFQILNKKKTNSS